MCDPLRSEAAPRRPVGAAKKTMTKKKARKKKKQRPSAAEAIAKAVALAEPGGETRSRSTAGEPIRRPTSPPKKAAAGEGEDGLPGGRPRGGRCCPCDRLLAWCGFTPHNKTDDFVTFDDDSSTTQPLLWSLLWSEGGGGERPMRADDYLEFVPEHERDLVESALNRSLPRPAEVRCDY